MTPYPAVTAVVAQTKTLRGSHQRIVGTRTLSRMSAPPIVGVPLLILCVSGPSMRITWPICLRWSSRMNHGESTNAKSIAVTVEAMVRKGT